MGEFLFDIEPYTDKRKRRSLRRRHTEMPVEVRRALARLKRTLDGIPPEELQERRRRWELLRGHTLRS